MLRTLFLIVLLFGVVGGLSGKAAAEPWPPCANQALAQSAAMVGMTDCCPDKHKTGKHSAPCKDMAATCLATAGCATAALHDGAFVPLGVMAANDHSWFRRTIPVLYGRSIPPDPYPPSRLG